MREGNKLKKYSGEGENYPDPYSDNSAQTTQTVLIGTCYRSQYKLNVCKNFIHSFVIVVFFYIAIFTLLGTIFILCILSKQMNSIGTREIFQHKSTLTIKKSTLTIKRRDYMSSIKLGDQCKNN